MGMGEGAAVSEECRKAYLQACRARMKESGESGASVARSLGRSPSQINSILRGNYGYYQSFFWPKYFEQHMAWWWRLYPEDYGASNWKVKEGEDGTR